MGKFESKCQIFSLFAGAALVAVGVIFVLNIEANKRYGNKETESIDELQYHEKIENRNM